MAEGNSGNVADRGTERGERDDYAGGFDPAFDYEDLSKEALVRLVREYALIVHLLDRSMCAAIGMRYGAEAVKELAIEEWAGASPVYGERLRRIMASRATACRPSSRCCNSTPGSHTTTWTSTTSWSTTGTGTSNWRTAAR
jgi:hypothetical protein